jgi:hypothetical protein
MLLWRELLLHTGMCSIQTKEREREGKAGICVEKPNLGQGEASSGGDVVGRDEQGREEVGVVVGGGAMAGLGAGELGAGALLQGEEDVVPGVGAGGGEGREGGEGPELGGVGEAVEEGRGKDVVRRGEVESRDEERAEALGEVGVGVCVEAEEAEVGVEVRREPDARSAAEDAILRSVQVDMARRMW